MLWPAAGIFAWLLASFGISKLQIQSKLLKCIAETRVGWYDMRGPMFTAFPPSCVAIGHVARVAE